MRVPRLNKVVVAVAMASSAALLLLYTHLSTPLHQHLRDPTPPPAWLTVVEEPACTPVKNISFLKTHKCASSAIQNILMRYGERHDLLFALPQHNYFGGGRRYFHPAMLTTEVQNRLGFNIYAVHSKWNMTVMAAEMPANSVFVTIVREPADLFFSLYDYANIKKFSRMTAAKYVQEWDIDGARDAGYIGYNQMTWDLGMPAGRFHNTTEVEKLVADADALFHLVMVAERMPESLVLLRKLLCAEYSDVVVLRMNAREDKVKSRNNVDNQTLALLRERLAPDYLLYEHFVRKFDDLVAAVGHDQMTRELQLLSDASAKVKDRCKFSKVDGTKLGVLPQHRGKVFGYGTSSSDPVCSAIVRPEMKYLDLLRYKQRRYVLDQLKLSFARHSRKSKVGEPTPKKGIHNLLRPVL